MIMDQFTGNKRRVQPHVLFYSPTGRPLSQRKSREGAGDSSDDQDDDDDDDEDENLCVDARICGSEARAVRRSCRPTAELRHVLQNSLLQLWLVAGPRGLLRDQEVTIAFELPPGPGVECACGRGTACRYGLSAKPFPPSTPSKMVGRPAKQQHQTTTTHPPPQRQHLQQHQQQHGSPQIGQHSQQQQHGNAGQTAAPTRPKKLAL